MYRISSIVAKKYNDLVICNGESIGQVASQTLKSMQVIEKVASLPIIRPLAVEDKIDIINLARKINTYDISIRPYEDCCTIFEVKDPTTQPNEEKVLEFESKFNYEELIYECINNIEVVKITDEEDLDNLF
ncbi:probable tRNA sulfurtransferase [Firmicutes bacterium CAG:449]|nr:probable tRNA sulfurtransferase [Firmicutes bacterium CAG:449]